MLVYVSAPPGRTLPFGKAHLDALSLRLQPGGLDSRPLRVIRGEDTLLAVQDRGSVRIEGASVLVGTTLAGSAPAWHRVGGDVPDGSFALIRSDGCKAAELVSDSVGSRTLWYAWTPELFVASTSQRAIVTLLGSFEPSLETVAWKVSSGTLGPGLSWDVRIRALPPASRLVFDRATWKTDVRSERVEYAPVARSSAEHQAALREAIETTFDRLDLDPRRWVLPLSGGYDSRAILLMAAERWRIPTITWGLRKALTDRRSDAWIARELAAKYEMPHRYFEIDLSPDRADQVLPRFVTVGEGRTDRIGGYTDGFDLWKQLHDENVAGVLRGDEAFGCRAAADEREARSNMSLTLLDDFPGEKPRILQELAALQRPPESLSRRTSESFEAWRDRLNISFEFPYVFAPLNDLKLPYVDLIHPLTSRTIIETVRRMPDRLRTNKRALRAIVDGASIGVPIARHPAIASKQDVLAESEVMRIIQAELESRSAGPGMLPALATYAVELLERLDAGKFRRHLHADIVGRARRYLPFVSKRPRLDPLILAFRVYIAHTMQSLLEGDAHALTDTIPRGDIDRVADRAAR